MEVLPEIDSTNTELMRRARAGLLEPVLLVAENRPPAAAAWAGTGTATPGESLTFSLALPLAPPDWSGLSLAVGVSVAQSLHPTVRLKWPNDLWLAGPQAGRHPDRDRQLWHERYAVIGVGVNLAPREAAGLSTPPAWLQELLPGIDAPQDLLRLAAPLVRRSGI